MKAPIEIKLTPKQKQAMARLCALPEDQKRHIYDVFRKNLTMKDIRNLVKGGNQPQKSSL